MAQQDLTADMLTRIRNAARNNAKAVKVLNNKLNRGIVQVLKDEGYIASYDVIDDGRQGVISITLKYGDRGERLINTIDRVSRPGRRVYGGVTELPRPIQADTSGKRMKPRGQGSSANRIAQGAESHVRGVATRANRMRRPLRL